MAGLSFSARSWPRVLAVAWLCVVALAAALGPVLPLPYAPGLPDLAHMAEPPFGPSQHWFGTDPQGRDILSELIFGARTALLLILPAAVLSAILGALAGGAAGFWGNKVRVAVPYWLLVLGGGWWAMRLPLPALGLAVAAFGAVAAFVAWRRYSLPTWPVPINTLVMGAATTLDTIPRLVLVVVLAAGTGMSAPGLLVLLTFTTWPHAARLVRAQMLRVRALPFVEAARVTGVPVIRLWLVHAMPHALQPLRTALPLSLAGLLGLESTLSFLGIGLAPNVASWGRLLATVRDDPTAWWTFAFPCICLAVTIISLNTLGRSRYAKARKHDNSQQKKSFL